MRGGGIVRRQLAASRFAHREDTSRQTARKRAQLGAPGRGICDLDAGPGVLRVASQGLQLFEHPWLGTWVTVAFLVPSGSEVALIYL
jgi:hypothetical protein